ncbi:MAG TPA: GNAT family N-acetyltransferase [Gaiellaceae bacterium]|nr:GNAT family N-acetyltransferase [Gaiellaceae bacterium]
MIRQATTADRDALHRLWLDFGEEVQDAPWRDPDSDEELEEIDELAEAGTAWIAEDEEGEPVGIAFGRMIGTRVAELRGVFVRPAARGGGVAAELTRSFVAQMREAGAEVVEVGVVASNEGARATYTRWGFQPFELTLAAPVDELEQRLAPADGPTFGFVHVQTDDVEKVKRDSVKVLRLEPEVEVEGNWVRVRSDATDADPARLKALAKELSYTTGGVTLSLGVERGAVVRYDLFDKGYDVDEYLSVPEFYGPVPPGDAYALGANATVVARLTGADPRRVREVARISASPGELPPAQELYEQIATVMGVQP